VKVPKPQYPRQEENNRLRIPVPQSTPNPAAAVIQSKRGPSNPTGTSSRIQPNNFQEPYNNNDYIGTPGLPDDINDYCGPLTARGLHWNWTRAGDTAVLECPSGSIGFAKWKCDRLVSTPPRHQQLHMNNGNGMSTWRSNSGLGETAARWSSLSPSLAECQSKWLANLDSRLRDGESIGGVSGDLAQLSGLQPLYGGDLKLASKMLKHMAERMNYDIQVRRVLKFK
jgi:hypothetical protein